MKSYQSDPLSDPQTVLKKKSLSIPTKVKKGVDAASLSKLKPAFGGTTTAGNALKFRMVLLVFY